MPMTTAHPRLYYEERGEGEPLLVIHGFAASAAVLAPIAELYATRTRHITYDHPGTGRSSKAAFPCTTAALAVAATRVMDELGIESAHIAGVSLGGAVAQELAIRFPHRVRGLILAATSTAGPLSTPPDVLALAAAAAPIAGGSVQRRRLWLGPALFSADFLRREPDRADALLRQLTAHPAAPWGVLAQLLAAGFHDRGLDLHRIRAPTLVLAGDDDFLVPIANARLLADGIPDAELHVFPGARHGFIVEHLEETFDLITEWLERRRPTAGAPPGRAGARAEMLTRQLAVPLGTLRVGRSCAVLAGRALASAARSL